MPETDDKREEGKGLPKGSSGTPVSGLEEQQAAAPGGAGPNAEAQPAPASGTAPATETLPPAGDVTGGQSIGEFADSVVSGLEQAGLDPDLHRLDLEHMSEAFFSGWGSPDEDRAESDPHATQPANVRTLSEVSLSSLGTGKRDRPARSTPPGQDPLGANELSRMGMPWSASEGPASGGGHGRSEPRGFSAASEPRGFSAASEPRGFSAASEPRGFSAASDMSLASWGASEGVGGEDSMSEPEPEEELESQKGGLQTLAGLGFPSSTAFADYPAGPAADPAKHDELADAVESALRSVYGDQPAKPAGKVFQKPAIAEEKSSPSLVWNKGSNAPSDNLTPQEVIFNYFDYNPEDQDHQSAAQEEPESDGLTPQEVILNYFDYPSSPSGQGNQGTQNGNGYSRAGMPSSRDREEPIALRPGPEPVVALRRAPQPEERPVYRQEWVPEQPPQPQQYSGPPSFPVPGPALASQSKTAQTAAQESSRLLGAAAIGLMGGIAIAASLAAFLIYGPHPAAVEIPGIGNLRLDHDEQGYGRTLPEEAAREPARTRARAPVEMSSEILAADAVAIPGQPTPLAITIRSPQPAEKMLVSIAGVPEGARLSAGVDTGGGNWLVAPRRLNGLTINLPAGSFDVVSLEAQLLDSNARTPLSAKGTFAIRTGQPDGGSSAAYSQNAPQSAPAYAVRQPQPSSASYPFTTQILSQPAPVGMAGVQPAAPDTSYRAPVVAPPPPPQRQASLLPQAALAPQATVTPPAPFTQTLGARRATPRPEVEDLIREGNKRMREGDIVEARQFYQRAVAFGDAEAALAMGRSFDPIYFARIEKKNADPDAAKAFDWYKRAMDAGASQTAMVRIENLKHFLNE